MKKLIILSLAITIVISLSACLFVDETHENIQESATVHLEDKLNHEKSTQLSERQQKILEKEGLTTDYEQLYDSQKKSIIAIEEMFTYLDKKYETSFEYVGYRAASNVDKETLIVQPDGGTSADIVSVIREDGKCSDNYDTVYYRENYESIIKEFIKNEFEHIEVFSDIVEVEDVSNELDLLQCVSATNAIYVNELSIGDKSIADFTNELSDWYLSKTTNRSCAFSVYVIPDTVYWSITRFNRTNYDRDVISKTNIIIHENGSVVINET